MASVAAVCAAAQAQTVDSPRMSSRDAVAYALRHDPDLAFLRADTEVQEGVLLEARGLFDPSLRVDLLADYSRRELTPALLRQQKGRRELYWRLATLFQKVADDLRANIDEGGIPCTDEFDENSELVIIDPVTGEETIITCDPNIGSGDPDLDDAFVELIGSLLDPELAATLDALRQRSRALSREQIEAIIRQLDELSVSFREELRKLGATPTLEEKLTFAAAFGYEIPLRSGWVVTPRFAVQSVEDNFVGKPQDPRFGGKELPITIDSIAGLEVAIPLGEGGHGVADAYERAAEANYMASTEQYEHVHSVISLQAAQAYWSLVAAERSYDVALDADRRAGELVSFASALIEGDELPASVMDQVRARVSEAATRRTAAAQSVMQARVALAREIGMPIESVEQAPYAAEGFPDVPSRQVLDRLAAQTLIELALARRADLRSSLQRVESASILTEAARKNLSPRVDLTLFGGYTGSYAGYNLSDGLERALFGNWVGPSVGMSLTFAAPLQNRGDRGRLEQALALERRSRIVTDDTRRVIGARVVEALGTLRDAAERVRELERTEQHYRRVLDGTRATLRAGEGTVIDGIWYEEQLDSTAQALISARLAWALAIAQLRYETGTLLGMQPDGTPQPDGDALRVPPLM